MRLIDEGRFTVDGAMSVKDAEELTGTEFSDSDSETVAGFILDKLGRIPSGDEQPFVESNGLRFTALHTDDRRITEVLIERIGEP